MSSDIEVQTPLEEKDHEEVHIVHEEEVELADDIGGETTWRPESEIRRPKSISKPNFMKRKSSSVWDRFTIIDHDSQIATCNICEVKLSYKTTVSNLKKHMARKHAYDCDKRSFLPRIRKAAERKSYTTVSSRNYQQRSFLKKKSLNLGDIGGLDNLVLRVLGSEGDEEIQLASPDNEGEEVEIEYMQSEAQENEAEHRAMPKMNDHSAYSQEEKRTQAGYAPSRVQHNYSASISDKSERVKRNRIMDLQLECLEIQKYNMQMEALLMEQQLNLPRSIFTEGLRGADMLTRSTQTDVGGGNTKVFYVSDNADREGRRHLFKFQAPGDF